MIVDTKWKILSAPVSVDQELRQIFAYDVLWDAADGYLLYPKVEGSERRCGVLFAEVDWGEWGKENLLMSLSKDHKRIV